jgi:hypothetical protein
MDGRLMWPHASMGGLDAQLIRSAQSSFPGLRSSWTNGFRGAETQRPNGSPHADDRAKDARRFARRACSLPSPGGEGKGEGERVSRISPRVTLSDTDR